MFIQISVDSLHSFNILLIFSFYARIRQYNYVHLTYCWFIYINKMSAEIASLSTREKYNPCMEIIYQLFTGFFILQRNCEISHLFYYNYFQAKQSVEFNVASMAVSWASFQICGLSNIHPLNFS